jgi:MFS family permease
VTRPSRYHRLLAVPGSRALTAADLCARLPQGMLSVTVLLVVGQHTSMRVAGFALAGSTLGLAVTAPFRGRLADESGVSRVTPLAGLSLGPTLATLFTLTAGAVPRHNGTEAQAWLNSMMNGGAAAGAALAGLTARQPILGVAIAAAAAGMAALTAIFAQPRENSVRGQDAQSARPT